MCEFFKNSAKLTIIITAIQVFTSSFAASLETELSAIWEIAVSFEISDENGNLICKPEIKLQDPSQSPITAA